MSSRVPIFVTIGLISCSMLMYEILLTRIAALRLFFHFAFLVISNCLLAIGASGTLITIFQERWKKNPRFWIWVFCAGYIASLVATYAFLIRFNVNTNLHQEDVWRTVRFSVYNLGAAAPFFFAGTVIGLILTFNSERVNLIYGIDLLGAGVGCLFTPLFLWLFGAGGCFVFLSLLAVAGTIAIAPAASRAVAYPAGAVLALVGIFLLPSLDKRFPVPGKGELELTENNAATLSKQIMYSKWSATSRIDLINLDPGYRFMFCRGTKQLQEPLPDVKLIVQDCTAATLILNYGGEPNALNFLAKTMYTASYRLKEKPRVFVIGVGGGPDIWSAKISGASFIKGIELNQQILDIHTKVLPSFSKGITDDPNIQLVFGEGRASLMKEKENYDVIQMTGIDTFTSLASGAYVLAENYLYTREAVEMMYDHLNPGGIMQISRIAADMEALRMMSIIQSALEGRGVSDFKNSVMCLQSVDPLMAMMVKKGAFTPEEVENTEKHADEAGLKKVYLPGRKLDNLVEKFIETDDKAGFMRDFPRNITPTTDDKPYFFNFYKWRNPWAARKYLSEPSQVSHGNPLFLFGQLALSSFLALVFLIVPLWIFRRRGIDRAHMGNFLIYFAGLGMGFIGLEVSLIQKLTLFLGHPLYSISVTLFSILIFTGLGSVFSARWLKFVDAKVWLVPIGLAVLVVGVIFGSPALVQHGIALPLPVRIAIAVVILAPFGLLLGVPFAYGIRLLNTFNVTMIPWAWAVNASCTVVGSILTVIVSMALGFRVVMALAVVIYFIAFAAVSRLRAG